MWSRLCSTDNYKQSCQLPNHVEMPSLNLRGFSRCDLEFFFYWRQLSWHISSWRDYKTCDGVRAPSSIRDQQSMRGSSITWMLIYCCGRANLLPLVVVKSTALAPSPIPPLSAMRRSSHIPWFNIPLATDSSLSGTALEIQYVSLTSMQAICTLRFWVEQYTRDGTKLAYCAPDLGLRIWDIAALMMRTGIPSMLWT